MGFIFKENCPDTRNTKVIDIYRTLENFTAHIVIYDPWTDAHRAEEEYAVKVKTKKEKLPKNNDVVVLCVAHNEFLQMNIADYLNEKGIIYDVKGKLRMFISVDLPEPDCPMMATKSPFSIDRLTSFKT